MIIKSETKSNYTLIPNEILNNPSLSCKAKGLLLQFLLSEEKGQTVNMKGLIDSNADGEQAIRSGVRELEEAGFLR